MSIYCGNNLNDQKLVSGTHILGTNYQCLRKGIGVGKNLPYDSSYAVPHNPVDGRRFYCGNAVVPPPGYFGVGSPSKCLSIGIGIGKAQRVAMGPPAFMYFIRYILPYILFFILSGLIFVIIYFVKPKVFVKKNIQNKDVIDWSKFIPYFVIICLLISISIWLFWKKFVLRWI
jgi:hypothetical protein